MNTPRAARLYAALLTAAVLACAKPPLDPRLACRPDPMDRLANQCEVVCEPEDPYGDDLKYYLRFECSRCRRMPILTPVLYDPYCQGQDLDAELDERDAGGQ